MLWMRSASPKGTSDYAYSPCVSIDLSNFPELDKEVGEEVLFVVKGVIRSKRLSSTNDKDKCAEVEVREIGVNRDQMVDKQRDMWTQRSSPKSLKAKADVFTEGLMGPAPKSGLASGMVILNDADIQLNKMLSK